MQKVLRIKIEDIYKMRISLGVRSTRRGETDSLKFEYFSHGTYSFSAFFIERNILICVIQYHFK